MNHNGNMFNMNTFFSQNTNGNYNNNYRGSGRGYANRQRVDKVCFGFNGSGCTRSDCTYPHKCSACKGNHPVTRCNKQGANATSSNANSNRGNANK